MQRIYSSFEQGEIILIDLPFTNRSKLRPGLIISGKNYSRTTGDIIVLKITGSNFKIEWEIPLNNSDLIVGKLKKQSYIDVGSIHTLEQSLAIKTIAKINNAKLTAVKNKLTQILTL